jgi:ectoine hydroxylase-related dioxygenase (phytanoyl-CoA dioxygenase family)
MFQQLLFQRSNGHLVHQDTSVVAVEEPLLLAATWVALQDVIEGSGELAFYDRSHRLPHYLFPNGTKRISFGTDDQAAYAAELDTACKNQGLPYDRFMAKKGDVFIWAADLVHASHKRTLPEDTNRLSCVTHYHPDTTVPFWFRFHPDHMAKLPIGNLGHYVSQHYPLNQAGAGLLVPDSAALR